MSYLLDDKKLILKDLILKNEAIKRENKHIELENEAFLCLIEKYEEKKKLLKVIEYIHYVCTTLYKNEEDFNCINNDDNFLNNLEKLVNNSILKPKEICKNILVSNNDIPLNGCAVLETSENCEKKKSQAKSQTKNQMKNPVYDININDIVDTKWEANNKPIPNADNVDSAENVGNTDEMKVVNFSEQDKEEEMEEEMEEEQKACLNKEKNICLHWNEESSTDNFFQTEEAHIPQKITIKELNLMGKQQLIFNEIEKIKNKIKELTLYFENAKIIVNSVICQSKIFLFDITDEIRNYQITKENIKKNKFLMKKSNTINEFYNNIMNNQKKKIEESQKTNDTLINLYKKKYTDIKHILSNNKDINTVDFLYLHVLIRNKKLNYDNLMRTHENDYAYLRKLISDINTIDNEISESEKKEKEILANLEKNNVTLNEMDSLIISLTNQINKTNESSNKINNYEHIDTSGKFSVIEFININKEILSVEKKIKCYERKIENIKNVQLNYKGKDIL
ncbi:conserved Plasmodium protein, unknown function [Plasmodium vinckei brucechwatti]|uniref:Uncharacterized protein n=1 Tax=Plasmodium vinckei brucechwatti TaxID=119398 RepID=A0A6V7S0T1_PLAVN|nr:conserved Plasmodium protein, unknown function [Plasmodium vinckei brucechwatti]